MKIVAFITEYNPFHHGHKYHLEKSKTLSGASHSMAIMSSSFLQRGEPSFLDKWTRAKMAVENGVDLVIELPFVYSCQSAELFAQGGVNILNSLKCVDYISFGSEFENIDILNKISHILLAEPLEYKNLLKENLNKGLSFPKSRNMALKDYASNDIREFVDEILNKSNNILAIEYLKALNRSKSKIKALNIKRLGADYKDLNRDKLYSSATAIRRIILSQGLTSAKNLLPSPSYDLIKNYLETYKSFNLLNNYETILRYLILTSDKATLKSIFDMDLGLENRIIEKFRERHDLDRIIDEISSKRHPKTRINRILIHLLNRLSEDDVKDLYSKNPPYIRILGSNKKGLEIINEIKSKSKIPIITKFTDYKKYNNEDMYRFIEFEERATDLYFLGLNNNKKLNKMDYLISPYIKK